MVKKTISLKQLAELKGMCRKYLRDEFKNALAKHFFDMTMGQFTIIEFFNKLSGISVFEDRTAVVFTEDVVGVVWVQRWLSF